LSTTPLAETLWLMVAFTQDIKTTGFMRRDEDSEKDEPFLKEYKEQLVDYMRGNNEELHLAPMNSYFRRLVHQLAMEFNLQTHSEGDGAERHVVLTKNAGSSVPDKLKNQRSIVWNFGDNEFLVDPLQAEVEVFLGKDGSVGLFDESLKAPYIAKRKVVSGVFKIKMNKIVELHDEEW
jgi:R3H domain-containing protein